MKQAKNASVRQIRDARVGTLLFLLCWAAYCVTYFGRLNYSAVMTQILAEQVLSKAQAGALGTAFFFSYAMGQLICGWVGDRIPPRLMVFGGLLLSGGCNFFMGAAVYYPVMAAVWCLNGLAQAALWPPILRIFCERYEERVRMRACVQINTSVPIGTLVTYAFAAWSVSQGSWRMSFWAAGFALCVIAVVWLIGMGRLEACAQRDGVTPQPYEESKAANKPAVQKTKGRIAFFSMGLSLLCVALAIQGVLKDGVTGWSPVYLNEVYGMQASSAIFSTMLIPLLNLCGMTLVGWLMKRRGELENAALLFGVCGALVAVLCLANGASALLALILLVLFTTVMLGVNTLLISVFPGRFAGTGQVATASGILSFSVYMGSALSNYGIGALTGALGWHATILIWAALAVPGTLLCLRVKQKSKRATRKEE